MSKERALAAKDASKFGCLASSAKALGFALMAAKACGLAAIDAIIEAVYQGAGKKG